MLSLLSQRVYLGQDCKTLHDAYTNKAVRVITPEEALYFGQSIRMCSQIHYLRRNELVMSRDAS